MQESDVKHIYNISHFSFSDLDVFLHKILKEARVHLNAEAGTIYLPKNNHLKFHVFQNDKLSYEEIYKSFVSQKDLLLLLERDRYLAVDSFLEKKVIIVDDIYNNDKYDFIGVKEFDARFNYNTKSVICVPLIHPLEGVTLGVIQLLNKNVDGEYVSFDEKDKNLLVMLSSYISMSILQTQNSENTLKKLNEELVEANRLLEEKVKCQKDVDDSKSEIILNQSKMATYGEMISYLTNNWQTPLNKISTIASVLKLDIELKNIDEEVFLQRVNELICSTNSLSKSIDDFAAFHSVDKQKETFNISELVKKAKVLINNSLENSSITLVCELDKEIEFYGLKDEFLQCIINLISNSKKLLNNVDMEEKYIFINLYKENNLICLEIKDNSKLNIQKDSDNKNLDILKQIIEEQMHGSFSIAQNSFNYNEQYLQGNLFTIKL